MEIKALPWAKETSNTAGTGTITLNGKVVNFASFSEGLGALPTEVIGSLPVLSTALLRGWLTVKKGATALSDNT